jgi:Dynamin family
MSADRDETRTRVAAPGFHEETQESRVAASLHRIREIAVAEHRGDLAAAIDEELKHIAQTSAVTVVVAAEMSRGKSLLINALLEQEGLLPVDIDVSTGVYVLVQHGESAAARVFTRTSREPITISLDALGQWVSVAGNPGNARDVAYVEVDVPAPLLGEGLSFIDTPGVGGLDAAHGRTTLAALSDADALIFVLDASAPLSRPELNFLSKASQRIESVILVLTKTDVFPGWRTILDDDRQLLQQFAPRFADQEIIPVRSPLVFAAMRQQVAGDGPGADRLLGRSGIPLLVEHLRQDLLLRSGSIRTANAHRLALSVLWQLDDGYKAQLATLSGDTSPLRALQDRQRELAEQKSSADRWRQAAAQGFNDVDIRLTRELQEALVDFRSRFDTEIAAAWRPGRQLSFPAELEADLRLVEIALQRRLAECLRECAGQQAARLGIDEFSAPVATLTLPVRDRLDVHPVHRSAVRFAVLGGQLLSGAVGLLRSVLGISPLYVFSGVLGLATSLARLQSQRSQRIREQSEALRLLQAYVERFLQDCKTTIDEVVQSATDTTVEALQAGLGSQLQVLQVQIQDLTKRAAEVKEAEATRALLSEKRAAVAALEAEHQVAFGGAPSVSRGSAPAMTLPGEVSSAGDYGMAGQGDS